MANNLPRWRWRSDDDDEDDDDDGDDGDDGDDEDDDDDGDGDDDDGDDDDEDDEDDDDGDGDDDGDDDEDEDGDDGDDDDGDGDDDGDDDDGDDDEDDDDGDDGGDDDDAAAVVVFLISVDPSQALKLCRSWSFEPFALPIAAAWLSLSCAMAQQVLELLARVPERAVELWDGSSGLWVPWSMGRVCWPQEIPNKALFCY